MTTLNSPLELGVRALVLLTAAYPASVTLDKITVMDHYLLHSGDLDGPESIAPALSTRGGETSVKRSVLEHGLQLMVRAGLVDLRPAADGLRFQASESAAPFLQLIRSSYIGQLREVAGWVVSVTALLAPENVRTELTKIAGQWALEVQADGATDELKAGVVREVSAS